MSRQNRVRRNWVNVFLHQSAFDYDVRQGLNRPTDRGMHAETLAIVRVGRRDLLVSGLESGSVARLDFISNRSPIHAAACGVV